MTEQGRGKITMTRRRVGRGKECKGEEPRIGERKSARRGGVQEEDRNATDMELVH